MRTWPLLAAPIVIAVATAAAAAPGGTSPSLCLAAAERAMEYLGKDFTGSYRVTETGFAEKLNGKDRQTTLEIQRMHRGADGSVRREVLRAERDGKAEPGKAVEKGGSPEVAAEPDHGATASEGEGQGKPEEEESGEAGGLAELRLPTGADIALFRLATAAGENGLAVTRFEPLREHRKRDDFARGRVACDPATGQPAWIEIEFARLPRGLSEFRLRVEFAREGTALYARRTVIDGVAGLLFIKRRFHEEQVVDELRTEP